LSGFFNWGFGVCLFGGFSGCAFLSPVRVLNANLATADWVASYKRIGTNAFISFCLNAEFGVGANVASVGNENTFSVEEGETVTLPERKLHSLVVALETGLTALSFKTLSEKPVKKAEIATGPGNGYANLGM
jgi:hypothetical protein